MAGEFPPTHRTRPRLLSTVVHPETQIMPFQGTLQAVFATLELDNEQHPVSGSAGLARSAANVVCEVSAVPQGCALVGELPERLFGRKGLHSN